MTSLKLDALVLKFFKTTKIADFFLSVVRRSKKNHSEFFSFLCGRRIGSTDFLVLSYLQISFVDKTGIFWDQ